MDEFGRTIFPRAESWERLPALILKYYADLQEICAERSLDPFADGPDNGMIRLTYLHDMAVSLQQEEVCKTAFPVFHHLCLDLHPELDGKPEWKRGVTIYPVGKDKFKIWLFRNRHTVPPDCVIRGVFALENAVQEVVSLVGILENEK